MNRFIIIVVLLVIAATAGTIYMGGRTFDGVVVDRPYEAGLAWDEVRMRQDQLGWQVALEKAAIVQGENEVVFRLSDRVGNALNDAAVTVTVSRPSTKDHDRSYRAKPLGKGRYQAAVAIPLPGLWDLRTTVSWGSESFIAVTRIETAGLVSGLASAATDSSSPCDVQKAACAVSTASGLKVIFSPSPRPVRAMADLEFTVELMKEGKPVEGASLVLDLSMPGMFMGSNQPMMREETGGRYSGRGVIPRCITGQRTWKAFIAVHHGGTVEQVSFLFEVQ